jgi:hypothetical protein
MEVVKEASLEGQKRLHESKRSNFDEESIPCPNEL